MTVAKAYKDLAEAGFVEGRAGGGTHVRAPYGTGSRRARGSEPATAGPLLSERLYELSHAPGVIGFTGNYPAPDADCAKEFETCLQSVISDGLSPYFAYDPPNGRISFRRSIVEYLAQQGPMATPEDVIVTSGAQQAIELVVRLLVPHGSPVIVERPSYYGVINALRSVGARILEVPIESDGMDIEKLEAHLARHRPRLIYTNPTFQNPTGVTTSLEKRHSILALARKHGVVDPGRRSQFGAALFRRSGPFHSLAVGARRQRFLRAWIWKSVPARHASRLCRDPGARAAAFACAQGAQRPAHDRHHAGSDGALPRPQKLSENS